MFCEPGQCFETFVEPGLPPVLCDRTMVEQVLLNLARNAMQAMDDPSIPRRVLEIRARRAASNQHSGWVEFAVGDLGTGIPAEVAERLFTPFQRLHREADFPGTGIGLATAKRIVDRHGGSIRAESSPGRGTTFHFSLPAAPATARDGSRMH